MRFADSEVLKIKGINRKWTKAGSYVDFNKNGIVKHISFDWFEEPNACCDCHNPSVEDGFLLWDCQDKCYDNRSSNLFRRR